MNLKNGDNARLRAELAAKDVRIEELETDLQWREDVADSYAEENQQLHDRAERAEAERDALREVLKKAEEALDQAECVIDADDSVEVFNYVQAVRKLACAALNRTVREK